MSGRPRHLVALIGLGAVVLALAVVDAATAVRPALTLAFFALGPGAALVARLRPQPDPLVAASLALALSAAVSMGVAQVMVWTGWFSPITAVVAVLVFMVVVGARRAGPDRQITEDAAV